MAEDAIEDSGDKIRRNLVMISTAIIMGAFLGVKVSDQVKIMGFADIPTPAPWKVWTLLCVVIIYLALRYHFDELTENLSEKLDRLILEGTIRRVERAVKWHVCAKYERGLACSWIRFDAMDTAVAAKWEEFERINGRDPNSRKPPISVEWGNFFPDKKWSGRTQPSFNVSIYGAAQATGLAVVDYKIPFHIRAWVTSLVLLRVVFYSKIGVNLLFPYILSFAAFGICVWQIVKPSFPKWTTIFSIIPFVNW